MHEKELINILGVARGEVDAPLHRHTLRRAVLSAKSRVTPIQNVINILSMNKYYVSLGSVAAVVAVALVVAISPLSPQVVSAQEQVNRAFARAVAISPEMRAQLEGKMKADMLKTLEEAKAAPDLKIMTREEYEKDAQFTISKGPMLATGGAVGVGAVKAVTLKHVGGGEPAPEGASFTVVNSEDAPAFIGAEAGASDIMFSASAAVPFEVGAGGGGTMSSGTFVAGTHGPGESFEPVKYLSYTSPEGHKVVLGLDSNDTPVFKMATLSAGDIKHLKDGSIQIEGQAIKMINMSTEEVVEE